MTWCIFFVLISFISIHTIYLDSIYILFIVIWYVISTESFFILVSLIVLTIAMLFIAIDSKGNTTTTYAYTPNNDSNSLAYTNVRGCKISAMIDFMGLFILVRSILKWLIFFLRIINQFVWIIPI